MIPYLHDLFFKNQLNFQCTNVENPFTVKSKIVLFDYYLMILSDDFAELLLFSLLLFKFNIGTYL